MKINMKDIAVETVVQIFFFIITSADILHFILRSLQIFM